MPKKLIVNDNSDYVNRWQAFKWFSDGDVHAYFNPYDTPYEGFMNFMNAYRDLQFRLSEKGVVEA